MVAEPAALATLLRRRSVPAWRLEAPGPQPAELELALEAALRAPDHGALRPWRFVLVRTVEARSKLSALLAGRLAEREPQTPPAKLDRVRSMPLSAPLVIVVAAAVRPDHPKVPEQEQVLAVGAGVMNLMQALHLQGYGSIWLTGGNAYDPQVSTALGLASDERCCGFLYVGTPRASAEPADVARPVSPEQRRQAVREWF